MIETLECIIVKLTSSKQYVSCWHGCFRDHCVGMRIDSQHPGTMTMMNMNAITNTTRETSDHTTASAWYKADVSCIVADICVCLLAELWFYIYWPKSLNLPVHYSHNIIMSRPSCVTSKLRHLTNRHQSRQLIHDMAFVKSSSVGHFKSEGST